MAITLRPAVQCAALLLLLAAAAAALGPPPGSRGTLDFRYPDYIVEPRVPCLFDGFFPHPRNCTWYYRCHDRLGLGYYWRSFYECEPGTVFSDDLDQCVFGSVNENCVPTGVPTPSPPFPHPTPTPFMGYPPPTTFGPQNTTLAPRPITIDPAFTTAAPTDAYTTVSPSDNCNEVLDRCRQRAICPISAFSSMHVQLVDACELAVDACPPKPRAPKCPGHELYDRKNKRCLPNSTNFCRAAPPRENSTVVCEDVISYCRDSYVCPDTAHVPEIVRRCDISHVCYSDGVEVTRTPVCPLGELFDAFNNKCGLNDPDFYQCDPSVEEQYGVPVQPQCTIQTELCSPTPLCNSPSDSGLVCRQMFSCGLATERRIGGILAASRYPGTGAPCIPNVPAIDLTPTTDPPTSPCITDASSCQQEAFCPALAESSVFVQLTDVCQSAISVCSDGSSGNLCKEGQVYDNTLELCRDASNLCQASTPRPDAPLTCEDVLENCIDQYICPNTPLVPEIIRRCDVIQKCYREEELVSSNSFCSEGLRFDAMLNQCVLADTSGSECDPSVVSIAPEPITCENISEVCSMTPVCNSVDSALVCHSHFLCPSSSAQLPFPRISFAPPRGAACVTIPEPITCEDNVTDCHQEAFCPQHPITQSQFIKTEEICRTAAKQCSDGSTSFKCDAGEVYVKNFDFCATGSELCQALQEREPSPIVCEDEVESCQDSYVCQTNPYTAEVVRRCSLSQVCRREGEELSRRPLCEGGRFDAKLNQCVVDSPGVYDCSSSVTTVPLPEPECLVENENCLFKPVCRSDLLVLQCHQLFSCTPSLTTVAPRAVQAFGVFGIRQQDEECVHVPGVSTPPAPVTCEVSTERCQQVALCPSDAAYHTSLFTDKVDVCSVAENICTNGTKTTVCALGELYQVTTRQCLAEKDICKGLEDRLDHPIVCVDAIENCEDSYVCNNSPYEKTIQRRCDMFRTCTKDGQELLKEPVCPGGSFDALFNQCVDNALGGYKCIGEAAPPPRPVCKMESEKCQLRPVCESQEEALSCVHLFSCASHTGPMLRTAYLPNSNPSCVKIPSLGPAVCENKVESCKRRAICPSSISSTQFVPVATLCSVADNVCSDGTSKSLCQAGELYDRDANVCVTGSSLCEPAPLRPPTSLLCEDQLLGCADSFLCPEGPQKPQVVRRCEVVRVCSRDGGTNTVSNTSLCPAGQFDAFKNRCTADDEQTDQSCPADTLAVLDLSPLTCQEETEVCVKKPVCNYDERALLCHKLLSCQTDTGTFFARSELLPDDADCIDSGVINEEKNTSFSVKCENINEIPFNDASRQFLCKDDAMCKPPQAFVDLRKTCEEFYRCKIVNNVLTPVKESCPAGQVLEYRSRTCVQQNTDGYMLCSVIASMASPTPGPPTDIIEIEGTTATPRPPKEEFALTWNTTLQCTFDKEIPVNNEVMRNHCVRRSLCDRAGVVLGNETLCRLFYVCRLKKDKHFVIDQLECTKGLLFSYDKGECVKPSANVCKRP